MRIGRRKQTSKHPGDAGGQRSRRDLGHGSHLAAKRHLQQAPEDRKAKLHIKNSLQQAYPMLLNIFFSSGKKIVSEGPEKIQIIQISQIRARSKKDPDCPD